MLKYSVMLLPPFGCTMSKEQETVGQLVDAKVDGMQSPISFAIKAIVAWFSEALDNLPVVVHLAPALAFVLLSALSHPGAWS